MTIDSLLLFAIEKEQITKILFIVGIVALFYMFSIRPQRKKYNNQKQFINQLKPGMQIVTIDGSNMLIDKNAISVEATTKHNTKDIEKSNEKKS